MTLVMQCPVCSQGLSLDRPRYGGRVCCPSCQAELHPQMPPLTEDQIMDILNV